VRDVRGRPVPPDRDAKVSGQKAEEAEADDKPKGASAIEKTLASVNKKLGEHDSQMSAHHDRLSALEKAMGVAKPADGMKAQDQAKGEGGNAGRGHDTTPRARQRH